MPLKQRRRDYSGLYPTLVAHSSLHWLIDEDVNEGGGVNEGGISSYKHMVS